MNKKVELLAPLSASTTPPIILDVASSNWASYKQQLLRLLQTKFGKIGDSITSGIAPPLFVLPTRLDTNVNGEPIYSRVPLTAAQVADNVPLTANDLTPFGYDIKEASINRLSIRKMTMIYLITFLHLLHTYTKQGFFFSFFFLKSHRYRKKKNPFYTQLIMGGRIPFTIVFTIKFYVNEGCLSPAIFSKRLIVPACSNTEETVTEDNFEIAHSLGRCILHALIRFEWSIISQVSLIALFFIFTYFP